MVVLVYILTFLLLYVSSFFATYIVSIFSPEKWNIITISISAFILLIWYIILSFFWLGGMIGVLFWTIFTIPVFMKFLWFEVWPALWISFLFSIVFPIIFALIISILT